MNPKKYYQNKLRELKESNAISEDNAENENQSDDYSLDYNESDDDVNISYSQKKNFDSDEPDVAGRKAEINSRRFGKIGSQG